MFIELDVPMRVIKRSSENKKIRISDRGWALSYEKRGKKNFYKVIWDLGHEVEELEEYDGYSGTIELQRKIRGSKLTNGMIMYNRKIKDAGSGTQTVAVTELKKGSIHFIGRITDNGVQDK